MTCSPKPSAAKKLLSEELIEERREEQRRENEQDAATVYVVMGFDYEDAYEDAYIESIWTTKEAADKHLAEFTPPPAYETYQFAVEAYELRTDE